ncbi:hypothetical protein ACIQU6_03105 [Streptomyces sp. NPDC090442]|jgi:hypothetical protein|uniref:hypothetical protein n=1 Tax=Streptomyces sp. NPDC090442 TaxID=3365962 RepID=UPI00380CFE72
MRVDPTDPDTFEEAAEAPAAGPFDVEAPEADAAEQHADLAPQHDDTMTGGDYSANEADRAEQARVVELNEDEYR